MAPLPTYPSYPAPLRGGHIDIDGNEGAFFPSLNKFKVLAACSACILARNLWHVCYRNIWEVEPFLVDLTFFFQQTVELIGHSAIG